MIHTFYSIQILFHYFTIISFLVGDTSSSSFSSSTDGFHTVMWYTVGKKVGYLQAREISFQDVFFPLISTIKFLPNNYVKIQTQTQFIFITKKHSRSQLHKLEHIC